MKTWYSKQTSVFREKDFHVNQTAARKAPVLQVREAIFGCGERESAHDCGRGCSGKPTQLTQYLAEGGFANS